MHGNIIGYSDWPINQAGPTFHYAIHAQVPHAHCVMHVHTIATQAVCCLEDGLSFSNFYAALNFNPKFGGGQDAFDALQRVVDRIDPSYRG